MLAALLLYSSSKEFSSLPLAKPCPWGQSWVENFAFWFSQQTKKCVLLVNWNKCVCVGFFWLGGCFFFPPLSFPSPCGMKKPEIPFVLTQLLGLFQDKTLHFLKIFFSIRVNQFWSILDDCIFLSFPLLFFFLSSLSRSSWHVVVA